MVLNPRDPDYDVNAWLNEWDGSDHRGAPIMSLADLQTQLRTHAKLSDHEVDRVLPLLLEMPLSPKFTAGLKQQVKQYMAQRIQKSIGPSGHTNIRFDRTFRKV